MVCEAGLFSEGMGKFKDIELCTTFTAYYEPKNVETYILYADNLIFGQSLETSIVPPTQIRVYGCFVDNFKAFHQGKSSMWGIYP